MTAYDTGVYFFTVAPPLNSKAFGRLRPSLRPTLIHLQGKVHLLRDSFTYRALAAEKLDQGYQEKALAPERRMPQASPVPEDERK